MRREFDVPIDDEQTLNKLNLSWEAILSGSTKSIVIHDFEIPNGYNVRTADVLFRVDGYPLTKLDMAYFSPALSLSNGNAIKALNIETIDGKQYQRWSRHYDWRKDIDTMFTHIEQIKLWLTNEVSR